MNKAAYVAAAAAAVLIVGLPPVLGWVTETQVRARTAEISQSGVWTAEVRSFERGWFRGRAKIDLALSPDYASRLGAANAAGGAPELGSLIGRTAPVDVEFAFGPVAVLDGVHFGLSKMVARLDRDVAAVTRLEQSLNVPHLFEFRGRAGFLGTLAFDADMPPIEVAVDSTRVQFSGALLAGTLAGKRLVANTRVDRFELSSPTGVFTVENAAATVDNELRSRYVTPGNAGFSIRSVAIVDAQRGASAVFEAAGLRVDTVVAVDETNNLLDVQATYALDSALVDGARIADARVGLALRRVDAAALEAYAASLGALGLNATAGPGTAMRTLRPAFERALAAGPSVTLDPARFTYDGEKITARLEIVTNAAALPAAGAIDFEDPAALLALFGCSAEIELSKKLAQELARLAMQMQFGNDPTLSPEQQRLFAEAQSGLILVTLVAQGFLDDAGDAYRAELRVVNGAITLNGSALPF
jgi:hypothetical protein